MSELIRLESPYKIVEKYASEEDKKYFELDDILVNIALSLINYRIKNNLTQKELAQKLGMTQAMVSKLESGEYNPTVKMLYEISKTLGLEFKLELREKVEPVEQWIECSESFIDVGNSTKVGDAA